MGRTQAPLTSMVDREMQILLRVADRARLISLKELSLEAIGRIRELQNAAYDELLDPRDLVFLALLSVLAERCEGGGVRG